MTTSKNVPHGQAFFWQMQECKARYRLLGDAFHVVLGGMRTVLDVGCGVGIQTARLCEGGFRAVGVDAFDPGPAREPGFPFFQRDVLEEPFAAPFDAVICTETAEHIYPERADRLVEVVTMMALERIIWSAAGPGQDWEGHVNMQPMPYWLEKLGRRGFVIDDLLTGTLRSLMLKLGAQHSGATHNFLVLRRATIKGE